jgi:signal transduction histidine kinase
MEEAHSRRGLVGTLVAEWREMGWVGKAALLGILASVAIAIGLGFSIPASARRHLLEAQTDIMRNTARELVGEGLLPDATADPILYAQFDEAVRLRLLGGETVRVKVWTADGMIVYSDAVDLIGQQFELSEPARAAFDGRPSFNLSDLSDPAHELERDLGRLIEFYIPIEDSSGAVLGALEVEQRADALETTLGHIQRNVWISIGLGLGVLSIFMASLTLTGARITNRRRRLAENLLGQVLRARDEERKRIVGALHDDVGQTLYRLLYRLEGSQAKVDDPTLISGELTLAAEMVREIDGNLRSELRLLHRSEVEDVGLRPALTELIEATRSETELAVSLDIDLARSPGPVPSSALFAAAEEGLINARKHARATSVSVRLWSDATRTTLEVADDGVGVDAIDGIGLATTRERLDALGGGLWVRRRRGGGTLLRAWVTFADEANR